MTTQQIPSEKQPKPKYMAKCVSLTQEADKALLNPPPFLAAAGRRGGTT